MEFEAGFIIYLTTESYHGQLHCMNGFLGSKNQINYDIASHRSDMSQLRDRISSIPNVIDNFVVRYSVT